MKCDHIREIKLVSEAVRDGFMTLLGPVRYSLVLSSAVWYCLESVWYGLVLSDTVWYCMVWLCIVWLLWFYDSVRTGLGVV